MVTVVVLFLYFSKLLLLLCSVKVAMVVVTLPKFTYWNLTGSVMASEAWALQGWLRLSSGIHMNIVRSINKSPEMPLIFHPIWIESEDSYNGTGGRENIKSASKLKNSVVYKLMFTKLWVFFFLTNWWYFVSIWAKTYTKWIRGKNAISWE